MSNRVSQEQVEGAVRSLLRRRSRITTVEVLREVFGPEQGHDRESGEAVFGTLWAMYVRGELVDLRDGSWTVTGRRV